MAAQAGAEFLEALAGELATERARRQVAEKRLRSLRARKRGKQSPDRAERSRQALAGQQSAGGKASGARRAQEAAQRRAVCDSHFDLWWPKELWTRLTQEATRLHRPVGTLIVEIVADWFAVRREWEMSHGWPKPWDESRNPPQGMAGASDKPLPFKMRTWKPKPKK